MFNILFGKITANARWLCEGGGLTTHFLAKHGRTNLAKTFLRRRFPPRSCKTDVSGSGFFGLFAELVCKLLKYRACNVSTKTKCVAHCIVYDFVFRFT